jgi:hypothetical protein
MDIAAGADVTIFSDCKSALYRGSFFNILSGWKKPIGALLKKVRAHPEKFKKPGDWDGADKGIWVADQISGKQMKA